MTTASTLPNPQTLLNCCRSGSTETIRSTILQCVRPLLRQNNNSNPIVIAQILQLLEDSLQEQTTDRVIPDETDTGQAEVEEDDDNQTSSTSATIIIQAWVDAVWFVASSLLALPTNNSTTQPTPTPSGRSEGIVQLTRRLAQVPLARPLMLQCLEADLLHQAGLVDSADIFLRKIRFYNTQTFYKQQKYNLIAEESEGYSKYLTLLTATAIPEHNMETSYLLEASKELIASFRLDPIRCLDLTLCILVMDFSQHNHAKNHRLVALLQDARPTEEKIPALINFQIQGGEQPDNPLLAKWLECMTWLTQQHFEDGTSILSPPHMWSFLWGPDDDKLLHSLYEQGREQHLSRVRALGTVRLTTGDAGSIKDKENVSAVEVSSLSNLLAIKWLQQLTGKTPASTWIDLMDDERWSKLIYLLPADIGVPVCEHVQKCVALWLRAAVPGNGSILPWTVLTSNIDSDEALPSLEMVINVVIVPMQLVFESACIVMIPVLYSQLCRLLALLVPRYPELKSFVRSFMIPSLSLFPGNPAVSQECWRIFSLLPYRERYRGYATWQGAGLEKAALRALNSNPKPLWLIQGEMEAGKDVRYALKRLSKDTIRDMSRAIAKVCYSNPLVVFCTILNQIEAYDNMIHVMVDALRLATPLALDVLVFCILNRLSGTDVGSIVNRSRLKEDGTNVSQWLQSLESFAGALYRRFPTIELQGILNYLLNRLKDGHVMELGILRTILKTSGGWSFSDYAPAASLAASQLEGRAGTTLLQRETMSFGVVEEMNDHASQVVRGVLQQNNMGVSLLVLLAQVRHPIVYASETKMPVKLIGNLVDTCQVTLSILLDFLSNASSKESIYRYAQSLPSFQDLVQRYNVDVAFAWMLCRPLCRAAQYDELDDDDGTGLSEKIDAFKPSAMNIESLRELTWSNITPELFCTFYLNKLYDLFCPEDSYAAEIARLDKETERLSKSTTITAQPSSGFSVNESNELNRVKRVACELSSDYATHKRHVESVRDILNEKKGSFFASHDILKTVAEEFLTRCIYPRCMQGPDDALYCARFILCLHEMEPPGFSIMQLLDCLFVALSRCLFGLTEGEAANVSVLLLELWKVVSLWRYDAICLADNIKSKPGAYMIASDGDGSPNVVSVKEFELLYNRWHRALGDSCLGCLQSTEYIHKRCCLIVLSRMVDVFPTRPQMGNKLLKMLEPLQSESNPLPDIRAAAQAYSTQLVKARDEGVWKEESAADVEARLQKDKAAAIARQAKAEKQMEEMKVESEKITEEIGEWSNKSTVRQRQEVRGLRSYEMPSPTRDEGRPNRDERRTDTRRPPTTSRVAGDRPINGNFGTATRGDPNSSSSASGPRDESHRGLEGRWQRADTTNRGSSGMKRSRPSSPVEADVNAKRLRTSSLEPGEEEPGSRSATDDASRNPRRKARYGPRR